MKIDVLSNTLMQMKLKSSFSGATDAGGKWAIAFPNYEGFKLGVVLKGGCWISVEGCQTKYQLSTGDCALTTSGQPFVLASDLSVKPKPFKDVIGETVPNGALTLNGGGDLLLIAVHFQFDGHLPKIMFDNLPPVLHIPEHLEQAAILHWSLERFSSEFRGNNLGRALILNHLAPIMLLQILRIYLASAKNERNWLASLSDPKLSKAIEVMHSDYQRPWSLEELAKVACMSRSAFALNFKKHVGVAPMDYLTNWRMHIAGDLLQSGDHNIADVAMAVGYESESAFSAAFTRVIKSRPGSYKKSRARLEDA